MTVNHLVTGSNPVGGAIKIIQYKVGIHLYLILFGEMAEWSKATVLKTVVAQVTQGSNPCLSAILFLRKIGKVPEWSNGLPC